jgi:hypothetical protein
MVASGKLHTLFNMVDAVRATYGADTPDELYKVSLLLRIVRSQARKEGWLSQYEDTFERAEAYVQQFEDYVEQERARDTRELMRFEQSSQRFEEYAYA